MGYRLSSMVLAGVVLSSVHITVTADIYRIVDDEGRVSYTDQAPVEGQLADRIEIDKPNTQPALKAKPVEAKTGTEQEALPTRYDRVAIVQPANESTVPPGQMEVVVELVTEPTLAQNHQVLLLHNGAPYGEPAATNSFIIGDLIRGTHQIQARIIDENAKVIASSNTITLYVKRTSRLHKQTQPRQQAQQVQMR